MSEMETITAEPEQTIPGSAQPVQKRKRLFSFAIFAIVIASLIAFYVNNTVVANKTDWPTSGWKTSTPEEQGMDSQKLARLFDNLKDQNLHSMIIARNGNIVAEAYNSGNDADTKQDVLSVTKSVTSSLLGIAIEQGKIGDITEPAANYLPELKIQPDTRKQVISLGNLLTMTSGFAWNNEGEQSSLDMIASDNWIRYIVEQPMSGNPGTQFAYSNGNAHLLSPVLQKATGKNEFDYAKDVLFNPLGITNVEWDNDPQGVPNGAWGLKMTARDMLKFGYLYLNNGKWDGKSIVPKDWIAKSTQESVGESLKDGTQRGYGYLWWLRNAGNAVPTSKGTYEMFSAVGSGGQRIIVIPKENLVAVFTADNEDSFFADALIDQYVVPAITSSKALPANEEGTKQLQSKIDEFKKASDKPKQN